MKAQRAGAERGAAAQTTVRAIAPDRHASDPSRPGSLSPAAPPRQRWLRLLWLAAGAVMLGVGIVGIFLPLLPTTPFVLVAALCFARGDARVERWLLEHRLFGPMVRQWREHRAVSLRTKQIAIVSMAVGCAIGAWLVPLPWSVAPPLLCLATAIWLWRLPSRLPRLD